MVIKELISVDMKYKSGQKPEEVFGLFIFFTVLRRVRIYGI